MRTSWIHYLGLDRRPDRRDVKRDRSNGKRRDDEVARRMAAIGNPVTREDFLRGIDKTDHTDPF